MCLTINLFTIRHKARRDITVYKCLKSNEYGYCTPYQGAIVEIGETYKSKLIRDREFWSFDLFPTVEVGLHSFSFFADALVLAKIGKYSIAKCIIPKGAYYYRGNWVYHTMNKHTAGFYNSYVYDSYASDQLKYAEIIKY